MLEKFVNRSSAFPPFSNSPHNQRLTAAHVTDREHAGNGCGVIRASGYIAARVELSAYLLKQSIANRAEESHGDEHQAGVHAEFRSGDRSEMRRRTDADGVKLLYIALATAAG